jgi:hypothetical protein
MNTTRKSLIPAQLEVDQDWARAMQSIRLDHDTIRAAELMNLQSWKEKPLRPSQSLCVVQNPRGQVFVSIPTREGDIMKRTNNILKKIASFSLGEEQ